MTTNTKCPHKAVCLIQIEIHEVLPTGECSGKLVQGKELADAGLKVKQVLSVSGFNKTDCLMKLKKALDEFGRT